MDLKLSPNTLTETSDDKVFVYKIFSKPSLLESLKQIEEPDNIFNALKEFCSNKLKVCLFC